MYSIKSMIVSLYQQFILFIQDMCFLNESNQPGNQLTAYLIIWNCY